MTGSLISELKPKGKIITPFNVISGLFILVGIGFMIYRFIYGLPAVVNEAPGFPWGVWIGFNVMAGVAFAAGAYTLTFVVYILKNDLYHPIIRPTVLNGFLAYVFYAGAIVLDCGRWWHIYNPLIGNKFGVNAVLFLIAWHFFLYMLAELVEFSPAIAEWLGAKRLWKVLKGMTIGAVVFGITLSTLHQSALGALVLMAEPNIHPLWWSEWIPVLYFVSGIYGGISMVLVEGWISMKAFSDIIPEKFKKQYPNIAVGLAKFAAGVMFAYLFMKLLVLIHGRHWDLLLTPMGYIYIIEVIGLTFIPFLFFLFGAKNRSVGLIRWAAVLAMLGIILNRCSYVFIAYKWYVPLSERYIPAIPEVWIALTIVVAHMWAYRWVVRRMPVYTDPPEWAKEDH